MESNVGGFPHSRFGQSVIAEEVPNVREKKGKLE
jgi:hypothetical protein